MEASPRELRTYETSPGVSPFDDWLDRLRDKKGRAIIEVRLDRLGQGNFGLCKAIGAGVLELKIDFGPGYRIYFAEDGPRVVLLLIGGDKASQSKDIKLAQQYWQDYREGTNA
ncbi:MAG: type II toxin-antitoxin system RelE/ParE family toxin [Bryocella sp.]